MLLLNQGGNINLQVRAQNMQFHRILSKKIQRL